MLTIVKPLVNGLDSPLGLDVPLPRFSWQLESAKGGKESAAYRVKLSTSEQGLYQEGKGLLWDSGRIMGPELHLLYGGPSLKSNTRYWWQVGVWDRDGNGYEMNPAWWETGLFPGDWQAQWIWRSSDIQINDYTYFRKTFVLSAPVVRVKVYVSAHHVFQLYVNGERIGGYGSPAPTGLPQTKYYLAYEVTSLLLQGANCIGAVAHYLGGSGQNYVNGLPGFLLQMHVEYADGTQELVNSDLTWQSLRLIPHRIGTPYQQSRRLSGIEDYDASLFDPSWLTSELELGEEQCAPVVLAHSAVQQWQLKWQQIPEAREFECILPVATTEPFLNGDEEWVQVFDTGKIISGWPKITLPGIAGVSIQLRYAESLDDQGRVAHNVCNEDSSNYYDIYTMHGQSGIETWQPDFSFKAFRYVEVNGYPQPLVEGQLQVIAVSTDMAKTGHFHCSSPHINKLYEVSLRTQRNNVLGQVVDCPHREQAQYLADTDLQAETLLYNFDAYGVLNKTLQDFTDGQLEDGTFPFVYPSNYEHPDFFIQIPEWDMHYATLLWKLYLFSGDEQLLHRYYEPMRVMIDAYMSDLSPETGLIPLGSAWHISDWPYPTVEHEGDHLTVQQIKAWQALRITADAAALLGKREDQEAYTRQAARLKESILSHLYDPASKLLHDSSGSNAFHQGVNALALYAGLLPDEHREAAVNAVSEKPWESKTVLSLPLLRLLFEEGRQELAYHLLSKTDYPGWGYMITQGAETMWEGWDDIESHCHAWNGYPARLLQEYICGIQCSAPGFASVLIRPYFALDLDFAEAVVSTVRGHIAVRWERVSKSVIQLRVTIPCMMSAGLMLDASTSHPIRVLTAGGRAIWGSDLGHSTVDGIVRCDLKDASLNLELLSGEYEFRIHYSE
ncbi:family 78 glycoside hydrolase catalytic domain [Paenibacillus sp. GCM10028914]|uniref:family 78 glycoside hydrolase catalytic domain n=1 Tax=Paenibacillus sp. GCM10028914 TaxID=3273416 RepID=UPI00361D8B99